MSLTDEQIKDALRPLFKIETALRMAIELSSDEYRAIESATAAPLLERIKELETWQAEHWAALQHIDSFMIGRGLLRITEDGGPAAAAKNITNSIAELEQQLEVARKDAGRYRWILKNCIRAVDLAANAIPLTDAAIDAAISKEQA